jgi:hypothetical protein
MPVFCNSNWPGHEPGGLSAYKSNERAERIRVSLKYIGGTEFRVTLFGKESTLNLHHHDPVRLAGLIDLVPRAFYFVEGSNYLNLIINGGRELISMSPTPLTTCSLGRWAPKSPPRNTVIQFPPEETRKAPIFHEYLTSNILVGYKDGTTWLLSDTEPEEEQRPPTVTTFVITACDPKGKPATLEQNHANTLTLEQDLIRLGLEYYIGWGSSQDNLHAELSFCVPVEDKVAVDATRYLLTELAIDYEQDAIYEITGKLVKLVPCLDKKAEGAIIKFATKIAEPQSKLRQLLKSLRWTQDITPEDIAFLNDLIKEKQKDA